MKRRVNRQLVDETFDAYLVWRDECAEVWRAYRRWRDAAARDARAAFGRYSAALEREEHAAHVYGRLLDRA
jgi:hypothetical protein